MSYELNESCKLHSFCISHQDSNKCKNLVLLTNTHAGEICLLSQYESQQCLDVPLTFVEIPAYLLCRLHQIKYGHLFLKTLLLSAIKKFQMDKILVTQSQKRS